MGGRHAKCALKNLSAASLLKQHGLVQLADLVGGFAA
jgi:hypothetical protein